MQCAQGLADGKYLINGGDYCHHCTLISPRTQWPSRVAVFSPPSSERAHCLDPSQLLKKRRCSGSPTGLRATYSFSRSWGNMSYWFHIGTHSELSCSNKCTGEGGGTIIPGGPNCVCGSRDDLCFWKRNDGKNSLKHSFQCHFVPSAFQPPSTTVPWETLVSRPTPASSPPLHYQTHHIFPNLALQPYCWIQIIWGLAVLCHFFPKRFWTNTYWPTMCQAQG